VSLDLRSAAIVVYEAMAGRNPFVRETWDETLDAITHARAPDVREHVPDCPAEVAELLSACLSRDRLHRPANARDLGGRLRAALASNSIGRAA